MRFRVVHVGTGVEVSAEDLLQVALHEDWARGLVYCDIDGFYLGHDGELVLLDECGNYRFPPPGRFRVVFLFAGSDDPVAVDWPA